MTDETSNAGTLQNLPPWPVWRDDGTDDYAAYNIDMVHALRARQGVALAILEGFMRTSMTHSSPDELAKVLAHLEPLREPRT